jgi:hypothetical protein
MVYLQGNTPRPPKENKDCYKNNEIIKLVQSFFIHMLKLRTKWQIECHITIFSL